VVIKGRLRMDIGIKIEDLIYKNHMDKIEDINIKLDSVVFNKTENHVAINNYGISFQVNFIVEKFDLDFLEDLFNKLNINIREVLTSETNESESRLGIVLELACVKSEDELCQDHYDSIEDGLISTVNELISDSETLNKAINLLEVNNMSSFANKLKSIKKQSIANDWCHENL